MKRTTSLPPGKVLVEWDSGRVRRVLLDPPEPEPGYDPKLESRLLAALDQGPRQAGFEVDLAERSAFGRRVLGLCSRIRPGGVMTYGELAEQAGRPGAARAAGQVMARNPVPLLIPCHRVVRAGGFLGGFAGGLKWKEFLLRREGWRLEGKGRRRRLKREDG